MPEDPDRLQLVQDMYHAWVDADRPRVERLLAPDFRFSSGPDPELDRAGWFEVCWPGAGTNATEFRYERLRELPGDEVLVTYVATRPDGTRFQNTEIFGFDGDRIARMEVYFGWDLAG